jgi:hypothetical protein
MPPERFPRDKDELLREVDARIRVRDIRRLDQLKDRLAPKWWETGIVIVLFAASVGLLGSLVQYSAVREDPINAWLLFWFGLMILTTVLSLEFLLVKIYNLRRSNDVMLRAMNDLRDRCEKLERRLEAMEGEKKEG